MRELPIGGTALGTGLNAAPGFAAIVVREINKMTGVEFRQAENLFEAMQNKDACVETSGALKTVAVGLMKIANDLRLLTSGPRTGFAEIELPAIQPGSSIMPGKVNPVIPEAVNMVAAKVIGNDASIAIAGLNGNLDLNVMMPIIAHDLLQSIELEANAARALAEKCIAGITADRKRCRELAEKSAALVTAIAPAVGYDNAAKIFKRALEQDKSIRQVILEDRILDQAALDAVLDMKKLTEGGRMA
jgi:fumarate hydratase class II